MAARPAPALRDEEHGSPARREPKTRTVPSDILVNHSEAQMSVMETALPVRPQPSKMYRWLVLIFVSLAMFGNYYFYDALSPVADLLVKQLHFTDSNIGLLQGIYSFPNIFTVVIGGIIIDRIGLRRATLIFGVLCFIGAVINGADRQALDHGPGTAGLRHGRGIADCGGHHRAGHVVQGQRTQLRVRL